MLERKAYKVREVAQILGVDINSVYDMVKQGSLPAIRIGESGKAIRIPKKFVDDLLEGSVDSASDTHIADQ
jgi:excisionase family DNA binding protein